MDITGFLQTQGYQRSINTRINSMYPKQSVTDYLDIRFYPEITFTDDSAHTPLKEQLDYIKKNR